MKLKSKYKWSLVGLACILSWVGVFAFPFLGFPWGFPPTILSILLVFASTCYGIIGMVEAKVFERFFAWLKTDDV